jgi:hypothetical protein
MNYYFAKPDAPNADHPSLHTVWINKVSLQFIKDLKKNCCKSKSDVLFVCHATSTDYVRPGFSTTFKS